MFNRNRGRISEFKPGDKVVVSLARARRESDAFIAEVVRIDSKKLPESGYVWVRPLQAHAVIVEAAKRGEVPPYIDEELTPLSEAEAWWASAGFARLRERS